MYRADIISYNFEFSQWAGVCRSRNGLRRGGYGSRGVLSGPAPSGNHPLGLRLEPAIPSTHELLGYTCSPFGDWYTKLKLYTDLIPDARLRRPSCTRIRAGSRAIMRTPSSNLTCRHFPPTKRNREVIDKFCKWGKKLLKENWITFKRVDFYLGGVSC